MKLKNMERVQKGTKTSRAQRNARRRAATPAHAGGDAIELLDTTHACCNLRRWTAELCSKAVLLIIPMQQVYAAVARTMQFKYFETSMFLIARKIIQQASES
eukprot:jgi/Botrbrau1/16359/Bobra.178_1s0012.1